MLKLLQRNRQNIFLSFCLTLVFYFLSGIAIYTNPNFKEYLEFREDVLGAQDIVAGDAEVVFNRFLDDLRVENYGNIYRTTRLAGKIDFTQWHGLTDIDVIGGLKYEDDHIALARVDFEFIIREKNFDYPLNLVFVLEKMAHGWVVNDIDYGLDRYNLIK